MIKFIYFDVGGVVISDLSSDDGWAKMKIDLGIETSRDQEFEDFFKEYEPEVCLGRDIEDLVPLISEKFGIKFPAGYSLLDDFVNRFKRNESIWPIIEYARKHYRVGLLTNMYPRMLSAIQNKNLLPDIKWDVIIDSSLEHVRKPDSAIFSLSENKANVKGQEILFVDNGLKHVNAAKDYGWQSFWYDSNRMSESSKELLKLLTIK